LKAGSSPRHAPIPAEAEQAGRAVIDAAVAVHRELGPGLLESVYTACLVRELEHRGVKVEIEKSVPVVYAGERLNTGLRLDLLVARSVIVEVKAVESLLPLHEAQLLTYLKVTGLRLGLLINFNTALLKQGIKRMVL
jgi:GxxExxY protein